MIFNVLSGIGLILFTIIIIRKKRFLARLNVENNYLIRGNKPKQTRIVELFMFMTAYPMIFLWMFHTVGLFQNAILYQSIAIQIIGIMILYIGIFVYALALYDLGSHWRLGISYEKKETFQQKGIYAWSRHPAYFGFYIMFIGINLLYLTFFNILFMVLSMLSLYLLAREEEKYLMVVFDSQYILYKGKVCMFIGKRKNRRELEKV